MILQVILECAPHVLYFCLFVLFLEKGFVEAKPGHSFHIAIEKWQLTAADAHPPPGLEKRGVVGAVSEKEILPCVSSSFC